MVGGSFGRMAEEKEKTNLMLLVLLGVRSDICHLVRMRLSSSLLNSYVLSACADSDARAWLT